jgi:hypothetical protein
MILSLELIAIRSITGNVQTTDYQLNTTLINTFDVVEKSLNPNTTLLDVQLDKLKLEFVTYDVEIYPIKLKKLSKTTYTKKYQLSMRLKTYVLRFYLNYFVRQTKHLMRRPFTF